MDSLGLASKQIQIHIQYAIIVVKYNPTYLSTLEIEEKRNQISD